MGRLRKNVDHENKLFSNNSYFVDNPTIYKGKWNQLFQNTNPIEIEIGSGKGRFILEKAINNPNINFVAIDKFATVLYKVLKKSNNANIKNLKIICFDAKKLDDVFDKNEIDKIYLNFSDPWPKKRHEKNRLTSINFLNIFFLFLKKNKTIEFKTDNLSLFEYTLTVVEDNKLNMIYKSYDIYSDLENNLDNIQTEYEIKWLDKGAKIKKLIIKAI